MPADDLSPYGRLPHQTKIGDKLLILSNCNDLIYKWKTYYHGDIVRFSVNSRITIVSGVGFCTLIEAHRQTMVVKMGFSDDIRRFSDKTKPAVNKAKAYPETMTVDGVNVEYCLLVIDRTIIESILIGDFPPLPPQNEASYASLDEARAAVERIVREFLAAP